MIVAVHFLSESDSYKIPKAFQVVRSKYVTPVYQVALAMKTTSKIQLECLKFIRQVKVQK